MPQAQSNSSSGTGPAPCPVCGETLLPAAQKCKACGTFRTWDQHCESCGALISREATVCHECGRFPRNERVCASCGHPLPPKARTCSACGALQWFGGYLQLSQASLSLLIALISSLTTLGTVLANMHLPRSDTRVFFQAATPNDESELVEKKRQLWLLVVNSGNRPAGVRSAQLRLGSDPRNRTLSLQLIQPSPEQRLVQGGNSLPVELQIPVWDPRDFSISSRNDPKFRDFLMGANQLEIEIFEYGRAVAAKKVEGFPKPILAALLCRAATANPSLEDLRVDPCGKMSL